MALPLYLRWTLRHDGGAVNAKNRTLNADNRQ
jgi:hypothetical protein